ncbi:VOC family protein [Bryobacter aggregatus]|uniref:VOC family protein n=1 Tax=Bryobacter aggregatus TaxID=360054 RepID=UPI0004E0E267|nr:VOC family protein [Bryobacter aggregatus]
MKDFVTYLNFDRNAREAMTFYATSLGGELEISSFADGPMPSSPETKDLVMHARITKGGKVLLMASDCPPGMSLQMGNNFSISIDCESREEVDRLAAALGAGGTVVMAAQDMFWGAYFGMIKDKFQVAWMFNYDVAKAH